MRILHVLSSNSFSGAENVASCIIENLNKEYDLSYCCPHGPIEKVLTEKNINYISISKVSLNEVKKVITMYNPDIIHAHDYTAGVICSLIKGKKKLYIHLHNNSPWIKKINIKSFAFLFMAIKANKILTVSDSIEKEFVFSRFIRHKIICIGNPISRSSVLKKVNLSNKKYDICCVARISLQKNPLKFVNVISEIKKEIPDVKAIWVGDSNECDGNIKNEMLELITELGLENNIYLVGFQENPYVFLAQSKVFLLTSDWEGFGLAAFEALSLGLPGIVSNVGGLPTIVNSKCGKLCNTIDEYKEEIVELLLDKNKYLEKSKAAVERSIEIDNLESYIHNLDKLYQDI